MAKSIGEGKREKIKIGRKTLQILAQEDTLASILGQLDVESSDLLTALNQILAQLDVVLSTRASQATLANILTQLDVALSTRASEATLAAQLDITLSALRDALRGAGTKDFTTLEADIESILSQLDITLSSFRDALKGASNKDFTTLEADVESVLAQLDVALSTRATEATLADVKTEVERSDTRGYGTVTVESVSATQILATNSTRKSYLIYNNGNVNVYLGSDNSVTSGNGMPLVPGALAYEVCDKGIIYGRAASGTCDVRYWEVG